MQSIPGKSKIEILIVAGEASGDNLGAGLVGEITAINPGFEFYGIGGERMAGQGVKLIYQVKDLAVLGFFEVLKKLSLVKKVERELIALVSRNRPAMAILIDYPGFNLRLAGKLKELGVPIFYYVSPQIWAWGGSRIKKIKRSVDLMAVFFEFEKELYQKAEVPVVRVGHPLLDDVKILQTESEFRQMHNLGPDETLIGLFPGSREQEIKRLLPELLKTMAIIRQMRPGAKALIGKASSVDDQIYRDIIACSEPAAQFCQSSSHDLMAYSDMCLVCSGTATLECAIIGTPMLVLYKTSLVTYLIARGLIRVRHIGLVNIVAGKKIVPELIQHDCRADKIAAKVLNLMGNRDEYDQMKKELSLIRGKLGQTGAAARAAKAALELLGETS